jgi:uncharacterized membrane protein
MDNKKLGLILLLLGILLSIGTIVIKQKQDQYANEYSKLTGTCFTQQGECLHSANTPLYIGGWVISVLLVTISVYLLFFEKSQKAIISALENQKKIKINEEKFDILLKGLSEDEKKIIKSVKEQDGITQQTLRLRTDLHKSKLSIVLDGLEKKGLIKRIQKGKTKQVFLKINL